MDMWTILTVVMMVVLFYFELQAKLPDISNFMLWATRKVSLDRVVWAGHTAPAIPPSRQHIRELVKIRQELRVELLISSNRRADFRLCNAQ